MKRAFFKYSGIGNDFLLFEEEEPFPVETLCHPKKGVGADGVLLVNRRGPSHFQMRIFNRDGSEAEMCGNGLRAVFFHLESRFSSEAPFRVDSLLYSHRGWKLEDGEVAVEMAPPSFIALQRPFSSLICDLIDTGVPHLVLPRSPLPRPFLEIAPILRHHESLPQGANVNWLEKVGERWHIMTYERGVEGVTEACGTGAVASALSLAIQEGLQPPITLFTPGGEPLTVDWQGEATSPKELTLKGKVSFIFEGTLSSHIMVH